MFSYEYRTGIDGKKYMVWPSSYEREIYTERFPELVKDYKIASFGQFENAYCLTR
jgi:hypothetical protein